MAALFYSRGDGQRAATHERPKPDKSSLTHLDALRGLSALAVFLSHARYLFFADYENVAHKNAVIKFFYMFSGLGHQAVVVFFVLSGFFISASVLRAIREHRWSWAWYAQQRLTRLYVVLIPALVLGAVLDAIGLKLFGGFGAYAGDHQYRGLLFHSVQSNLTLPIWLGNLFFLQDIATPIFGSNTPLWSLSYEFWYYVLFPLGLIALSPGSSGKARVICVAASVLIMAVAGKRIDLYYVIWLAGALAGVMRPMAFAGGRLFGLAALLLFAGSLLASRYHEVHDDVLNSYMIGIGMTLLLYHILNRHDGALHGLYIRAARFLAGTSYTLYLVHVPILVFLNGWLIGAGKRWQPDAAHLALGMLVMLGVFLYSCLIWRLAESQTERVRNLIKIRAASRKSGGETTATSPRTASLPVVR